MELRCLSLELLKEAKTNFWFTDPNLPYFQKSGKFKLGRDRVPVPIPMYGFRGFLDWWFPLIFGIAAIVALWFFPPDPVVASYLGEGT